MEHDFLKGTMPDGTCPPAVLQMPAMTGPAVDSVSSIDPSAVRVGRWVIPPLTVATAQFLERIESPFVVPTLDPVTGQPVAVAPRISDVARALFILINQNDPRLEAMLDDRPAFERAVLAMSRTISFGEMKAISEAIQKTMGAVDTAMAAAGLEPSEKKADASRI